MDRSEPHPVSQHQREVVELRAQLRLQRESHAEILAHVQSAIAECTRLSELIGEYKAQPRQWVLIAIEATAMRIGGTLARVVSDDVM